MLKYMFICFQKILARLKMGQILNPLKDMLDAFCIIVFEMTAEH
jgi:hypothetical protein